MAPDFTEQKASDGPSALPCKDCDPQPLPDTPRTENGKLVRGPQVEKTLRCPGHSGGSCHLPSDLICPKTRPGRQYLRILPRLTRLPGAKGLELISKARRHPGGGLWAAITGLQVLGGLRPPPEETGRAGAVLAWRAPRRLGSHGGCGSARLSPSLPLGSGVSRAPSFPPPNPTGPLYSSSAQPQGWKRRSPIGPRARRRYLAGGAGPAPGGGACGTFRSPDLRRRGAVSGRACDAGSPPRR